MKYLYFFLISISLISINSCQQTAENEAPYPIEKTQVADSAMIVSPHPLASAIGVDILRKGGNAIDAAVAVQFAIAVTYPRAGNLGGGGFMVIRLQDGSTAAIDYREKAPGKAHKDMYLDSLGNVVDALSRFGHLAVGVPGSVDGLLKAQERFGAIKDRGIILDPAIQLAENGFYLSAKEAQRLNDNQEAFAKYNEAANAFMKNKWKAGDVLVQQDLAATLQRIKQEGRAGFYEGKTAELIVAEMEKGKGLISLDDLKNYEAQWRTPLQGSYKEYNIIAMPPASSGGIALLQLLKMVEPYPIAEWGFQATPTVHLMAEVCRRVYADRAEHLGDMDFFPVPIDSLLDEQYLKDRMADFSADKATESEVILAGEFQVPLETYETTHTSVIDPFGNAVSVTTTLNSSYGSKVVVEGGGFLLNNEMDDFSAKPGVPNQFGLLGNEANAIQPNKRMLSSMTPTIVEKGGELFMVLGTPGGSTIITSVFQVFLNVAAFGMSMDEAVTAKRFHHQWYPDEIRYEKGAFDSLQVQELEALGHEMKAIQSIAVVKAIHRLENGQLHGAGDIRNPDDDVEGF